MKRHLQHTHVHVHVWGICFALVAVLLVMSACGSTGNSSSSSSGSSISPAQLLQKSTTAMKQLKSAHTTLASTSMLNTGASSSGTCSPATPTTGTLPRQETISITGSGDEVFPDQASLHFTLGQQGASGQNIMLSEIVVNQKLYIQNAKGQWFALTLNGATGSSSNPLSSVTIANYNNLLAIAQKGKLTDNGYQTINGQKLRHLTVTFAQSSLKDLLSAMGQLPGNMSAQQQQIYDQLLSKIKVQQATLDLWINEANSYVYQEEFKLNLNTSTGGGATPTTTSGGAAVNVTSNTDTRIDYSKFNESVTISAPPNATPTNNILTVLQQ